MEEEESLEDLYRKLTTLAVSSKDYGNEQVGDDCLPLFDQGRTLAH